MKRIQITTLKVDEINPATYNPRAISETAFEGLKTSLLKFGMPEPLVVNKRGMVLVGGHQRLRAAQALGWNEVPCVVIELTESEEKALNVTLNNPRITGYFTDELQSLLEEIQSDLGDQFFNELKLDELKIPDDWDSGEDEIADIEENLDGIKATIKVTCPQDLKDEVLIFLKGKLLETSFEGVEVV